MDHAVLRAAGKGGIQVRAIHNFLLRHSYVSNAWPGALSYERGIPGSLCGLEQQYLHPSLRTELDDDLLAQTYA